MCEAVPYRRRRDRTDPVPPRACVRPHDRTLSWLQTEPRGARERQIWALVRCQDSRTTVRAECKSPGRHRTEIAHKSSNGSAFTWSSELNLRYLPGLAPTTRLNALLNAASDS